MNKATFMRWFWRAVVCILAAQVALMLYLLVAIIGTQGALIAVSILLIAQSVTAFFAIWLCRRAQKRCKFWQSMMKDVERDADYWREVAGVYWEDRKALSARLAPFERVKDERGRFVKGRAA